MKSKIPLNLKKITNLQNDAVLELLKEIVTKLANGESLDPKHKDHPLSGNWVGHRECHISPDWLLIYRYDDDVLVLTLTRTGSHSDLFNL